MAEIGIVIERPENKASHSKDVLLIKQNVTDGEPGNLPLESFPTSSPLENTQIHAQVEDQTGNGKLGDFSLSVEGKNENNTGSSSTLEIPESFPPQLSLASVVLWPLLQTLGYRIPELHRRLLPVMSDRSSVSRKFSRRLRILLWPS